MSVDDSKKTLATLEAQRDHLFKHLAKRYAELDYAAIRREEAVIEALARRIAGQKAAITRAGGSWQ